MNTLTKAPFKAMSWAYAAADERWDVTNHLVAVLASFLLPPTAGTASITAGAVGGWLTTSEAAALLFLAWVGWLPLCIFNPNIRGWCQARRFDVLFKRRWEQYRFEVLKTNYAILGCVRHYSDGNIAELEIKPGCLTDRFDTVAEVVRINCEPAATVKWRETRPDWITISTTSFQLPETLQLGRISRDYHRVYLGMNDEGDDLIWDLTMSHHLGIFGRTGGGKGGTLRPILVHAVKHSYDAVVLSGKPSGEFAWFIENGGRFEFPILNHAPEGSASVIDVDKMVATIDQVHTKMIERASAMTRLGLDRWEQYMAVDAEANRTLLVIDEFMQFDSALGAMTGDKETDTFLKSRHKATLRKIQDIAAMARSTGINLVLMTQKPDVAALGGRDFGGGVLSNLQARIVTSASRKAIEQALDEPPKKQLPDTKGRVYHKGIQGHTPALAQIAWIEQENIASLLDAHPTDD